MKKVQQSVAKGRGASPVQRVTRRHRGRPAPEKPCCVPSYQFRGIALAARALRVTPFWLRSVLKGKAESPLLIAECYERFPALVPPEAIALLKQEAARAHR